ncbi:MAG: diguanylate cyclase [Lysobacterales bacterium]
MRVLALLLALAAASSAPAAPIGEASAPAPATATPASADARLAQARALLPQRPQAAIDLLLPQLPQAAIDLLQPLWDDPASPARAAAGLGLLRAHSLLGQHQQALAIGDALDQLDQLSADARALALSLRMTSANRLRDVAAMAALSAKFEALSLQDLPDAVAAKLWLARAGSFIAQGQPAQAEAACRQGLARNGTAVTDVRQSLLANLAIAQLQQGKLADSIESFAAAEQALRDLGQKPDSLFLSNLSTALIQRKEWQRAIDTLERALQAAEAEGAPPQRRMNIRTNLGVAYNGMGEMTRATEQIGEALAIARQYDLPRGNQLTNYGAMLREAGRIDEALATHEEALRFYQSVGDRAGIPVALANIGETLTQLHQPERAAEYFRRAREGYLQTDIRPRRLQMYPRMIENLESLGRYAEALAMMREYKTLSDESVSVESNERIAKLEATIELARTEQKLASSERDRLQQESALTESRSTQARQRLINLAMALGLLGLGLFALMLFRQVRFKARANALLEQKHREIEAQRAHLEELNETVRLQSLRDALTGLPNRRYLQQRMEQRVADSDPTAEPLLLIMVDIDHFKRINDRLGHLAGDQALVHVAQLLLDCQGEGDVVVRWGGEEFLWLVPGSSPELAAARCEALQQALQAHPLVHAGQSLALTVSMGWCPHPLWPALPTDWHLSLRVADDALYQAKTGGRNRWVGYVAGTTLETLPGLETGTAELVARGWLQGWTSNRGTDPSPPVDATATSQ